MMCTLVVDDDDIILWLSSGVALFWVAIRFIHGIEIVMPRVNDADALDLAQRVVE